MKNKNAAHNDSLRVHYTWYAKVHLMTFDL